MYKVQLILKYLLKRRIAWVSLIAVILCTTMVLVVISVMGGWLNMFKSSFRGLSGDIVIHSEGLAGFPYYQQIIDRLKEDGDIQSAVPSIETYGLLNFPHIATLPVKVLGIPIAQVGEVNRFPDSLYRQHLAIEAKLKDKKLNLSADQRKDLERQLKEPPSFDLLDEVNAPLASLPAGLAYQHPEPGQDLAAGTIALPEGAPKELRGRLRYDALRKELVFQGEMKPQWKDLLAGLSTDDQYKRALDRLDRQSNSAPLIDYSRLARGRATGMIAGVGVIGIHRTRDGKWEGREDWKFETPVGLTVLDVSGGNVSVHDKVTRNYFIVDDSRTQVWQYDNNYVYVPFARLQKDLGLDAQKGVDIDGKAVEIPARATDVHVKVRAGIDPNDEAALSKIAEKIRHAVHDVMLEQSRASGGLFYNGIDPEVETWQETQRIWINAVENEKLLTVFLFGIISIVAIFLIFCIFYMIVVEKTRDIGIIKSVGATSGGVATIFLGYGLVIGLLGSGMGWLLSFLIVHNINELHNWLGQQFHVQIWNPEVYLFDKIPNEMSFHDIVWIVPIAVLSSVLGALVPALRAGRLNPVESLRWE